MEVITYGGKFSFERLDKNTIEGNGFTKYTDSVIAKTGLLEYTDSNEPTGIRIENRGAKELFAKAHLDSLSGVPLTYIHPEEMVDGVNYKDHIVGTVLNPRQDGDKLACDVVVYDDAVKRKIEDGTVELSEGYLLAELVRDDAKGHYEQVGMIGNHLAIVPKGRCGGTCKLNFDAKNSIIKNDTISTSNKKRVDMKVFNYDGVDYDLSTPEGALPLVKLIQDKANRIDTLENEIEHLNDTVFNANVKLENQKETIEALEEISNDMAIAKRADALLARRERMEYLGTQGITNCDEMTDSELEKVYQSVSLLTGRKIANQLNADAKGTGDVMSKRERFMNAQKNK